MSLPDRAELTALATSQDSAGDRARLAAAVRAVALELAVRHPGRTVEFRVPPFVAVQLGVGEGSTHRRGTPPNVVELDGRTLLALAVGNLTWAQARDEHRVRASGVHSDLAALFPMLSIPHS